MMHKTTRYASLLLALVLLLSGCLLPETATKDTSASDRILFAMDTEMSLRLYGDEGGKTMDELEALLRELDGDLSVTARDGALAELNRTGRSDNEHIQNLTRGALALSAETDGALDITLYPASLLWGFTTDAHRIPAAEELEALSGRLGMDRITLDETGVTLQPDTVLDFGALAKGYAADLCRAQMEQAGLSGILNLGGNIQTVGAKPDGTDWVIGIQDPDGPDYRLTLTLPGSAAVVTSGDYQRYFEADGVRYCHILDPETRSPVRGSLRSVTVVAEQGLTADGLATALFVLGREKGTELWRQRQDFEAIWMEADGTVHITAGLAGKVSGAECQVIEP